jgi:nucleotide-binding universal stress UspA family protein
VLVRYPYAEPVLLAARRLAWENGIAAWVGLIAGPVADGIVIAALQLEAGLVVLGARASRPGCALTRERVKRSSPVPVLTVG